MQDVTPLRQLAAPYGTDGTASSNDGIELTRDAPASVEAKLAALAVSNQKLNFENLELRLRLQRRKARWSFERKLLVIVGLGLLVWGLVVGLFLGLVVETVRSGRL